MGPLNIDDKSGNKKKVIVVIALFLAFITILAAVGILTAIIKNRTGALASAANINGYAGQQFQTVKTLTVTMTQYSPNMPSISNTCDSSSGGGFDTASGGIFKVINDRLRWTRGDLTEDYVFAEPTSDNIIPWNQIDNLAIVVPGFNNNIPIHVRDHYKSGLHAGENYLDLFVPCSEYTNSSKSVEVMVVDLTKPLNNSTFGPNVNGTYYPPLGGQKATGTNQSDHGTAGHGVFTASPFGDFSDVNNGAIDFNVPGGTPVFAAFDGTVVDSEQMYQPKSGAYKYGAGILWIKSADNNNGAVYAHIAFASGITKGSTVKKGQQIGTVASLCGSGQCVTFKQGTHLHFQIYLNKTGQTKQQIMKLFPNAV